MTHEEVIHGQRLARANPECVWGWNTPAGKLRAQRRAHYIAQGSALGAGRRALEIGCGTGLFTEKFSRTGAQLVAVDISPDLLALARQRGLEQGRVQFLEKPFEECHVEGPFDAVIGSSVLHHLDLDRALPKIYDLLKPGGAISFAEPNMLNPQIMLQKNIPWLKRLLGDSPDETAFVRWSLAKRLKHIGFEEIHVVPFDWLHPFTPRAFVRTVEFIGRILEAVPIIREFAGSLYIRARRPH